ncbi:protein Hook homolog 3-like [Orbicella faveolata]|uniref:protein Hook homolog 3-like n=1 Tax=Orbicella faveolata TaxID=48498 RepID=UPI0009E643F9|nr:protein Hook homolog 3-like [Orbicella faveolata]
MMDEELMCESLMKWVSTFEGIKAPHKTVVELTDGVALCECLAEIAPDWFDDEWVSKIRHDTGDNRRLKVNNLKKLVKGVHDYYTEVLTMDISGFPMPDVNAIGTVHTAIHVQNKALTLLSLCLIAKSLPCGRDWTSLARCLQMPASTGTSSNDILRFIRRRGYMIVPQSNPPTEIVKFKENSKRSAYTGRCPFKMEVKDFVDTVPRFLSYATCSKCDVRCKPVTYTMRLLRRKCGHYWLWEEHEIMSMEESVQHVVMMAIQELMTAKEGGLPGGDSEMFKELEMQHKRTLEQLSSIAAEKEELSQRCHELDEQLSFIKEHEGSLQLENDRLREKLSRRDASGDRDDDISFSTQRLHQLQQQVEQLKEENYAMETSRDEFKIKYEQMERDVLLLNERNEQLQSLAEESQMLKDEMDVLRHSQEKVIKYESTIELYKKKLEELSDMRKQMKALEEKNVTYMKETMNLQEDLRKANSLKTQVDTYKKQVHQLQVQVSDLQRRADKAEFEARKAKEKVSNLDGENERLRQERVKLKEENEELQLAQVAGSPMRQLSPGTPPSDDFDLGSSMSPEVKERILRLEHENKKLKEQKEGEQEEQNQLLQSLLNDANERKDQLEKENRELNQKLMEAESELDDVRNQKSAGEMDKDTELGKKYTDHLDKLKVASEELQKKKAYIDSLEPKVSSSAEKVNELQELTPLSSFDS